MAKKKMKPFKTSTTTQIGVHIQFYMQMILYLALGVSTTFGCQTVMMTRVKNTPILYTKHIA